MARRGRWGKEDLIDLVIRLSWEEVIFFVLFISSVQFLFVPILNNPILNKVNAGLKPFGLAVICALLLTLVAKYFISRKSPRVAFEHDTESPFAKTTLSEFLQRPTSWSLKLIQEIEWKRFEDLSAAYYLEKGILAKTTSLGADGGIDIKLYQGDTENATSLVQCKAWNNKQIDAKEIREFRRLLKREKVAKGFYMTSGEFTADAKEMAKANKIILINGEMFLSMLVRLPELSQKKLLELAIAGDYKTPTCFACGVKMVKKVNKRGEFWGCKNYPKCRKTMAVKS